MKRSIPAILLSLAMLFAAPGLLAQTVERWVDEDGVTQYTDKASVPDGVPSETVDVPEPGLVVEDSESTTERLKRSAERMEQDRKQRAAEAEAADRARALEESQAREEIFVEPEKKKKKKRRSGPLVPPPPPPKPEKPPKQPGIKQ